MIFRALTQLLLVTVTAANFWFVHNPAVNRWSNRVQNQIEHAAMKSPAMPLKLITYQPAPQPTSAATVAPTSSPARAAVVFDLQSARRLYAHNADTPLPIASLTKLTTALVIVQHHQLSEMVTIPTLPPLEADLSVAGIRAGQRYSVNDLLRATLIGSAADAATALAVWDAGSENAFIAKMNQLATQWQLAHTHYSTVVGIDKPDNFSSANDLLVISRIVLAHPSLAAMVAAPSATITDQNGQKITVTTTNELLNRPHVFGMKTGTTGAAGQCFISYYNNGSRQLLTVVLNSPDRFADTLNLLNTSVQDWQWL